MVRGGRCNFETIKLQYSVSSGMQRGLSWKVEDVFADSLYQL